MNYTKRCFESVGALGRHNQVVLRRVLGLFPRYAAVLGLDLSIGDLNLELVRAALMGDAVPAALDDLLYFSSALGNSRGWSMIERQAEEDGLSLPCHDPAMSNVDMALLAAIHNWPDNQHLLERANARARIHGKSSFKYYAPASDHRNKYHSPTPESLRDAEALLKQHFIEQGFIMAGAQERSVRIIHYEYANEIWFLIWYADKKRRHRGCEADGEWKYYDFNPEQFDAVVYNKVYGDIRMNTKNQRKKDHSKYRIAIGHMLLGDGAAFLPTKKMVVLRPLEAADAMSLFATDDIPGLASIEPVQLDYLPFGVPRRFTVKAYKDSSLLVTNELAPRLVPDGASVASAIFEYRLSDSARRGKLSLSFGNKVSYERDGDSLVLEEWLRRRGFVLSFVEGTAYGTSAAEAAA